MIVRQIGAGEIAPAIQLIWDTFLQFEAPDYSNEGVRAFRSFIENREIVASLEFFGAYENGQLRGVLATNAHRRHICCFFVDARFHRQGSAGNYGSSFWPTASMGNLQCIPPRMLCRFIISWDLWIWMWNR